jgi:hypothetical protein
MTDAEYEKECPLFPAFPNYTKEMFEGNKPCGKGHELVDGGYADKWQCKYGGGETDKGNVLYAVFHINYKISIFIIGNHLRIADIRYSGKPDVYEYTNDGYLQGSCLNNKTVHKFEMEKVKDILNRKYECEFWKIVQKRAKELVGEE